MSVWRFPTPEALLASLGALPSGLVQGPVRYLRDGPVVYVSGTDDPAITGWPQPFSGEPPPGDWQAASTIAEVVPVRAAPLPEAVPTALFVVEGEEQALALAGEMVRLGCDRQELAVVGGLTLLKVSGPPYYSVLGAVPGAAGPAGRPRCFVPCGRAWIELGASHPLLAQVRPASGQLLLAPCEGAWRLLPDGPWTALESRLDLVLGAPISEVATAPQGRVAVPLRLGRAPQRAPGLWITDDLVAVDRLVQELPEAVAATLDLAVLERGAGAGDRVIFRARPRARGGTAPELPGLAYSAHEGIAGLFLPVGTAIEPPLRAERLRAVLAPPPGTLGWVERGNGLLTLRFVDTAAFVGLDAWIDYRMDRDGDVLAAWVAGTRFQFESLVVAEPVPTGGLPERRPRERRAAAEATEEPVEERAAPTPRKPERVVAVRVDLTPDAAALAVDEAERAFLATEGPGDAPERAVQWAGLAALYARAGRSREAGTAWARAAWVGGPGMTSAFAEAMTAAQGPTAVLLSIEEPHREQVRAVAAALLAGDVPVASARAWLERHAGLLDLRTTWLTAVALAGVGPGRDRLVLARARDRVFAELEQGQSGPRELPTFLRFSGVGSAARLAGPLDRLRTQFFATRRARHLLEAPVALTHPYVDLVFAWGFARLGVVDRAADLRTAALRSLTAALSAGGPLGATALDPVHDYCANGLAARIAQALDGEPLAIPLPPRIADRLAGLTPADRYKVDRFRKACTILEPQHAVDPLAQYVARPRVAQPSLAALTGLTDPDELALAIDRALDEAAASPSSGASAVYGVVLDLLPALRGTRPTTLLARVLLALAPLPVEDRAPLAAAALAAASFTRDPVLVDRAVAQVSATLGPLGPAHPLVTRHLPGVLRSLRRSRSDAGAGLLDALLDGAGQVRGDLPARLGLAGAMLATGRLADANAVFDATWRWLGQGLSVQTRLPLFQGLARACAFGTPELALQTAQQMLSHVGTITDFDQPNTHFCVSVVAFAECLVLCLAHEELALGDIGRRLVDEDEFLLRQRVHCDLAGA